MTGVTVGFILAVLSSGAIAFWAYQSTRHLIASSAWVTHTDEVLRELEGTLGAVTQAETAERGFILTGNDSYLQSHSQTVSEISDHLASLQRLTGDNSQQQNRLLRLRAEIDRKLAWQATVLNAMGKGGSAAADRLIATGEGQRIMETIREIIREMTTEEQRLLRQRTDKARADAALALRTVALFAVAAIFFLTVAYRLIMSDLDARHQVQRNLEIVQEQLRATLDAEQELARIDPLTGVANRRAFFEITEAERKRAERFGHPLTIAYIDADNLKQVNDSLGHEAGDAVLKTAGDILRLQIRSTDAVARLGGDEFALLLPGADVAAAEQVLHKLQETLLAEMEGHRWPVTFSIGAVVFVRPYDSCNRMLAKADTVMYSVKTSGKNALRIELATVAADKITK